MLHHKNFCKIIYLIVTKKQGSILNFTHPGLFNDKRVRIFSKGRLSSHLGLFCSLRERSVYTENQNKKFPLTWKAEKSNFTILFKAKVLQTFFKGWVHCSISRVSFLHLQEQVNDKKTRINKFLLTWRQKSQILPFYWSSRDSRPFLKVEPIC